MFAVHRAVGPPLRGLDRAHLRYRQDAASPPGVDRATPDTRTVGQQLAHIALGSRFAHRVHGDRVTDMSTINFQALFQDITAEGEKPRTKAETIDLLRSEGDHFASFLKSLPESVLAESVKMMPGASPATRTRFEMLLSVKEHEMHHRAQLMLIERLLGIVPHLTREFQERIARFEQPSGAAGR